MMNHVCQCPKVHEKNEKVLVSRETGEWYRGLCKVLQHHLYPSYRPKALQNRGAKGGARAGRKLDRVLEKFVREPKKKVPKPLVTLMNLLATENLTPFLCQLPAGCAELRLGTRADLVCKATDGSIVVIEIKTGYEKSWGESQGFFSEPFVQIPITPENIASLQLAFTCRLLTHNGFRVDSARLVHVQENQCVFGSHVFGSMKEAEWQKVWDNVRESKSLNIEQRKRKIVNAQRKSKRQKK